MAAALRLRMSVIARIDLPASFNSSNWRSFSSVHLTLLFASMLIAATFFYRVVMRYYARFMFGMRLNSNQATEGRKRPK
jgi:hypothetical protein